MAGDLGIIVQARMESTRLPGKMLLPFYGEKGIFQVLIEKIQQHFAHLPIIVATTTRKADNQLAVLSRQLEVKVFRGDEGNVLKRFVGAAQVYEMKRIIRVCADNPFLDMDSLGVLINKFQSSPRDYIGFILRGNMPSIKTHFGFWAEAVSLDALMKVINVTSDRLYFEHVTNYIYGHKDQFETEMIRAPEYLLDRRDVRLTIDTVNDFKNQKAIFKGMMAAGLEVNIKNVVSYIDNHPKYIKAMEREIALNEK